MKTNRYVTSEKEKPHLGRRMDDLKVPYRMETRPKLIALVFERN